MKRMSQTLCCVFSLVLAAAAPVWAQTQTITLHNGVPSEKPKLSPLLNASKQVMAGDFRGAEMTYSAIIANDSGNIEAYLQRGVMRRELGDQTGRQNDGAQALALVDDRLRAQPNSADLYRQRSMAERLLKDYAQARADMLQAIRLSGNNRWQTDLQAIELERKMGQ